MVLFGYFNQKQALLKVNKLQVPETAKSMTALAEKQTLNKNEMKSNYKSETLGFSTIVILEIPMELVRLYF